MMVSQQNKIRDLKELGGLLGVEPKTAAKKPPFWDKSALPIRLDRLVSFIHNYKRTHGNACPPINVLMEEMEETEEAIRFLTHKAEARGDILVTNYQPYTVIIKGEPVPLVDARRLDNALKSGGRGWETTTPRERFEIVDGARMRLAHFIGEFWEAHGIGPSFKEMGPVLATSNPALIEAAIANLQERGIVTRSDKPRSIKLTENGGRMFGSQATHDHAGAGPRPAQASGAKRVNKITPEGRAKLVDGAAKARAAKAAKFDERVDRVMGVLNDYWARHGHMPPRGEVMRAIGYSPASSGALYDRLLQRGLLQRDGRTLVLTNPPESKAVERRGRRPVNGAERHPMGFDYRAPVVIKAIADYYDRYGFWPRQQAILSDCGYSTSGGMTPVIQKLRAAGLITKNKVHGPLMVTDKARKAYLSEDKVPVQEQVPDGSHKRWVPQKDDQREELPPVGTEMAPECVAVRRDAAPQPRLINVTEEVWQKQVQALVEQNTALKQRLADALTREPEPALEPKPMDVHDMVLALIDAGYVVRRA